MPRWTPAPIVGGAYKDDARAFSVQDTVNWIPERAEAEGTRSDGLLRDAPGAHVICDLGTNAPIRGLHNAEGRLLAVSGNTLFEVGADFLATSRGTVPGVSRVSIAHNQITDGNEVLIANGQSGYVYNTVTEALAQITDVSYPGAIVVDYLAQVLVQIEPQRRFWFHSDVTQATQYISTDQYEAESAPDLLVTLIASHGQLLVLGDRTGEFYAATGGNTSFFERMEGTTMEVGCASAHSVVRLDSTVFWIGSDGKGYRLNGYNAQRITTHAIEQAWSRCDLKKAFAFTFEDRGHTIVYFTFPDGATWGYDVATQEWHRRKSKDMNRWRMNALVYWNGHWIGGDYASGKLYRLDWDHKLECCEPLERERISGVLHDNQNAVGVNAAEFVFETGGPLSVDSESAPSIAGAAPDMAIGDVVSYQYAITPAYPGQQVTLAVGGTLPPGLTLSASGLLAGTVTGGGTLVWTITPSSDCATGETLNDSVVIPDDIASAILEDAPILYWRLNESSGPVIDYSGNGYHGTITGTPTQSGTGLTLTALAQGVFYPGDVAGSVLDVGTDTGWALEAIITRSAEGGGGKEWIVGQHRSPAFGYSSEFLCLLGHSDHPTDTAKPAGGFTDSVSLVDTSVVGSSAIANATRTHLMVVRDPGGAGLGALRLYANGTEIASNTTFSSGLVGIVSNGAKFLVGSDADAAGYFPSSYGFLGKIEHVAVYDAAIGPARVLYHAQIAGLA